jgi:ABC-type transport system involved in multi-copper enzyme maturation permease subunit
MRTLTIAIATWREAIRQPVSIIILAIAVVVMLVSPLFNALGRLEEDTAHNAIRQMSVAQTLMCGIVIAIFSASAVLAEEIENRTVLSLLAKPVRRWEIILGKFLGIMLAVALAFLIMTLVSFSVIWWTGLKTDPDRVSPWNAATKLPWLLTGQSELAAARTRQDALTAQPRTKTKHTHTAEYAGTAGELLLLLTGQTEIIAARAPLSIAPPVPQGKRVLIQPKPPRPGLAALVRELRDFIPNKTGVLTQAFLLAFVQVMVMAAFAIAVSTRLPLEFTALACTAVYILGNISRLLMTALLELDLGGLAGTAAQIALFPIVAALYLLPNFANFDLSEALSVGVTASQINPWGTAFSVAYGLVYTAIVLAVANALFRRREVT